MVGLDRRITIGIRRLDRPPDTTPDVQLPRRVEPRGPDVEVRRQRGPGRIEDVEVPANLGVSVISHGLLRLGKEVAGLDVPLGLGLEHARSRGLEIEILAVSRCDQRVEHRILKNGPPVAIARGALDEPRIGTVDPRRRDLGRRLFEIGTDPEAIMHPLGKRRSPQKSAARTASTASLRESSQAHSERCLAGSPEPPLRRDHVVVHPTSSGVQGFSAPPTSCDPMTKQPRGRRQGHQGDHGQRLDIGQEQREALIPRDTRARPCRWRSDQKQGAQYILPLRTQATHSTRQGCNPNSPARTALGQVRPGEAAGKAGRPKPGLPHAKKYLSGAARCGGP